MADNPDLKIPPPLPGMWQTVKYRPTLDSFTASALNAELLGRAVQRGAAAIGRAEESLAGLRRKQEARMREYGKLLVKAESEPSPINH